MSGKVTQRSLQDLRKGKTDWERIDRLTDAEIEAQIAADPDVAPIADAEWFRNATLLMPERKQAVSLRVDPDVLRWYKQGGPGYQSRMNAVLRAYAKAHAAPLTDRPARVNEPKRSKASSR